MATNVTEKDKTLNEIIDWAKSRCHEAGLSRFDVRRKSDRDFYDGQVNAFHEMLELCRSRLGYSGTMPSEDCFWTLAEPEMRANYIRDAREMLEIARKAVSE